jgi:pimeloyl-ACP methyl ester carboxylesterase
VTAATRAVVRSKGTGIYRASERHILRTSDEGRRNATTVGILALHGAGNDASFVDEFPPAIELAARGYLVLGIDAGGLTAWGTDTAIAAVSDGRTYLQANGAASGEIVLLGSSMGSMTALNWLRANPTLVACAALALPIPDVEAVRANNRGSLQAGIEAAYTDNAGWQTARPTHNPTEYVAALVTAAVPIRLDYSTSDTIGLPAETEAFASALGSIATLDSMGAVGHSFASLSGIDVADWVEAQLVA